MSYSRMEWLKKRGWVILLLQITHPLQLFGNNILRQLKKNILLHKERWKSKTSYLSYPAPPDGEKTLPGRLLCAPTFENLFWYR